MKAIACAVLVAAVAAVCAPEAAMGDDLDVPIMELAGDGQAATCASSRVAGLNPEGDGFLAVRAGPGADYRKIDELYNGDVVFEYERRGDWAGVVFRASNVSCAATQTRPVTHENKGWVHTDWLEPLAG